MSIRDNILIALWVVSQYLRIKNGGDLVPRTVIFGGKGSTWILLYGKVNHSISFVILQR